jgi:hypothetical protein
MGYREDAINAARRTIYPQIHYLLKGSFGGYAVTHTTADEYVLTAHCSEDEIESLLADLGFSRNPISAVKVRVDGNTAEGSWVWRASPLASYQLHVILHELNEVDGVDVYAHWECSWIRHPYKHYVARGYDAEKGVELTRRWLTDDDGKTLQGENCDIEYEVDDAISRQASEYFSLSYYRVKELVASAKSRLPFVDGDDGHTRDGEDGRTVVSPRITDKF